MSTSLAVYQRIADPVTAMKALGFAIAKSRMFGCENESQGEVLAMECLARGIPPLMLAEDYHLIEGKLSMRADAMLARFHELGGTHKIVFRTEDCAEIELTYQGQTVRERLTWEDAQKEPFPFAKDGKTLKKNWATPRARKQMLWARVVSEGIRPLTPEVNRGRYTPEELGDIDDRPVSQAPADDVIDASFVVVPDTTATTVESAPFDAPADAEPVKVAAAVAPVNGQASADQVARITELWGLLEISVENRNKQLAKRNASVARNLTGDQAAELIGALEAAYAKRQAESEPCSAEQVEQIRAKLREHNQVIPNLIGDFKNKIALALVMKIEELTRKEADVLLEGLSLPTADEVFVAFSLWSPAKRPEKK